MNSRLHIYFVTYKLLTIQRSKAFKAIFIFYLKQSSVSVGFDHISNVCVSLGFVHISNGYISVTFNWHTRYSTCMCFMRLDNIGERVRNIAYRLTQPTLCNVITSQEKDKSCNSKLSTFIPPYFYCKYESLITVSSLVQDITWGVTILNNCTWDVAHELIVIVHVQCWQLWILCFLS